MHSYHPQTQWHTDVSGVSSHLSQWTRDIGRSTSRDIGYVHFPAIDCPPLSMTCKKARCINTAATCREADCDAQDTIFYHDWQQHKQRNYNYVSVADAIKRVSISAFTKTNRRCYSTASAIRQYSS